MKKRHVDRDVSFDRGANYPGDRYLIALDSSAAPKDATPDDVSAVFLGLYRKCFLPILRVPAHRDPATALLAQLLDDESTDAAADHVHLT